MKELVLVSDERKANRISWYSDSAGNGGVAGSGGDVTYKDATLIFAYNGDMITNGNYEDTYYEYNKDGSQNENNILTVITKKNGDKIIPCKIFAQSGTIRETYTTNQGSWSLSKVTRTLDEGEVLPSIATSYSSVKLVKATNEVPNNPTTQYSNGYMLNQGIGSGAGYLESSNGTFTISE